MDLTLRELKEVHRAALSDLRTKQLEELHAKCIELGGHKWWNWQDYTQECASWEFRRRVKRRICKSCLKDEQLEIRSVVDEIFAVTGVMIRGPYFEDLKEETND